MKLLLFLAQLLTVLAVTYGCGRLLRRLGQPAVVGEIAGGLLLGPLVLGALAPRLQAALFPAASFGALETLSRIGLVLFLFAIGAELHIAAIANNRRRVAAITAGSVLMPFALGLAVAPLLWRRFGGSGGLLAFSLFAGVALSITALPVLASMLRDRERTGRAVPQETAAMALLSASVNDVLGWCVLAVVLAVAKRDTGWSAVSVRMGWLLLFVTGMLYLVRPLLGRLLRRLERFTAPWAAGLVLVAVAFASSGVTERLGLHAFFGAFLAGLCVPRNAEGQNVLTATRKWLDPAVQWTLPVFFALTGLRLQPGLFRAGGLLYLLLIVAVAVTGKIAGAAGMARWSGMPWREAGRVGVLLNTRGLVELIVLNVGYREGLLTAALFTLFVLMALLTTAMTAPLLNRWPPGQRT